MKTIAAATLFASVALAQTGSLIPSGISSACSSFLTKLDGNTTLSSCTSALVTATGAFAPTTNATASTLSASQVKTALTTVCAASSSCSEITIRSLLADFYQECNDELTTGQNKDVIRTYDVLYTLIPFKNAVCSKDDSGNFCVSTIASSTSQSSSVLADIAGSISVSVSTSSKARRADAAQVVASIVPNVTTIASNNCLFLLLQPTLPKDALCQTCTRSVITPYISFESSTPYAPGLNSSVLLSGQPALYQAVQSTCGSTFLSGAVAAAAGLSGGIVGQASSGASRTILSNSGIAGVIISAVAMVLGTVL